MIYKLQSDKIENPLILPLNNLYYPIKRKDYCSTQFYYLLLSSLVTIFRVKKIYSIANSLIYALLRLLLTQSTKYNLLVESPASISQRALTAHPIVDQTQTDNGRPITAWTRQSAALLSGHPVSRRAWHKCNILSRQSVLPRARACACVCVCTRTTCIHTKFCASTYPAFVRQTIMHTLLYYMYANMKIYRVRIESGGDFLQAPD